MAHNLFKNSMAFAGETPWHGLGTVVPPHVTAADMIVAANLAWNVSKRPAPGARHDARRDTYDRYLLYRDRVDPEKEDVALGLVGRDYTPLQNRDAFKFFEPLVDTKWAEFHTAGGLGNGERVWVLAKLSEPMVIARDDTVDRYVLLSNTHDGSGAVSIRFTPIRVVCQNTLNYALKNSKGVVSVRHTRHIESNLAKAQAETLRRLIAKVFTDAGALFGRMVLCEMSADEVDTFLERLFPRTKPQIEKDREPERWQRIRMVLDDAIVTPVATRNTLWALYNAVIRDEDYRITREDDPERRLNRVWFGSGHDLKRVVLETARQHLTAAA